MGTLTKVAERRQVREGSPLVVEINETKILLYNINGQYYASARGCPHMGAPLDEGACAGTEVICVWHHWSFDLNTGKCTSNPYAPEDLKIYPVTVQGNELWIEI
ncbi:MAG: Rieske 2Fe-2S domain-containing protein [Blastocatellia bacterium]|nr:Rieske 2Fe-2S domain-containing protein [Blastocatellia bacterium]